MSKSIRISANSQFPATVRSTGEKAGIGKMEFTWMGDMPPELVEALEKFKDAM